MKKYFPLFPLLFSAVFSFGQQPTTNTLLWRIAGKGLAKPSYLYGTMHLTDKRVFNFGDSLYKALEQTDGFAAELDMNKVGNQMINYFIREKEEKAAREPVLVKDVVSKETWEVYKEALEKRFYKAANKITVDDLEEVESSLKRELYRKGDMPTFLDAYLFGLARKQGKWVGGIEDLDDQLEHIASEDIEEKIQLALFDDKYYRSGIERMVKIYAAQQLDSIDASMYREEDGKKDYIMIKRNLKMAYRMDSLSAIRSMLFAVGAAHLPGDSGVIALLRSRGFVVTPVISSKKLSADKYVSKVEEAQWEQVHAKDSMYSLQMPGPAETITTMESLGINMKVFFDISFMKLYMTITINIPEERKKLGADSLFRGIRNQYSGKGKILSEKLITINGTEGREFRISSDEGEFILQIFIPRMERAILNAVYTMKEKALTDTETTKFFQSFVNNNTYIQPLPAKEAWITQTYPLHSFSVSVPVKLKETKDVNSEEGKIAYSYQGMDVAAQVFYGMVISSTKEGMVNTGLDTNYFFSVKDNLKSRFEEGKVLDSSFVMVNGFPSYSCTISGKSEKEPIEIKVFDLARGNRNYYLYAVYNPGESGRKAATNYLSSFSLLPYNNGEWKKVTSPDQSFSTTSVLPLKKTEKEENDIHPTAERLSIFDSIASVTLYIDKTRLPDWYWYETDTSFFRKRTAQYKSVNDSVTDYHVTIDGDIKIAEFSLERPGLQLIKKVKILLNGSELYEIFGSLARQDYNSSYKRFFDDFKILKEAKQVNRNSSGAGLLAETLRKGDKKTFEEVKVFWDDLLFTTADLPALQNMLLRIYPDFDTSYYGSDINGKIFEKIEQLDSSHTTVDYIQQNYPAITPDNEYIKTFIISYLSGIQTTKSYSLIKEYLTKYSYPSKAGIYFPNRFYDSLSLTATLYPELMEKADNEALWYIISSTTTSLIDSGFVSDKQIRQYSKGFMSAAERILKSDKQIIEDNAYEYNDLIKLLGIINNPGSVKLLNQFAKFDDRGLRFHTLLALLVANQPADTKTIYTLATTDEYRHDLYDGLKRLNKLNLFPKEFLTQKQLAQSKLYTYASDEDPPQTIMGVGDRVVQYKGKPQKFYLYKISFQDDGSELYLGISGPYSLTATDYKSTHEVTGLYWEKEFDPKKIDLFLKEYLASLDEE